VNARTPAPPGLKWLGGPVGRVIAMSLAIVALGLSIYVGYRYNTLVDCLKGNDATDSTRTKAIAAATDAERVAETAWLQVDDDDASTTRTAAKQEMLRTRAEVDRVRKANPPRRQVCG